MAVGKRFRIACIGAGNVGASVAQYCVEMELGDVVLTDVVQGLPQGKALVPFAAMAASSPGPTRTPTSKAATWWLSRPVCRASPG